MPLISRGKLKGFYVPDYAGGSILNLLSSVIRSRGGRSPHPELTGLKARDLAQSRNVLFLVVDGIGTAQLEHYLARGRGSAFFAAHAYRSITTVSPATTAAAVTTFATGASPAEHGVLSWFVNLHDLGLVSAILLTKTRTKVPMVAPDFDLRGYLAIPSHMTTTRGRRELLTYRYIAESPFNVALSFCKKRRTYKVLRGLERQAGAFARASGRGLAYAYWPTFDNLCHRYGCVHREALDHLDEVDQSLARIVRSLQGTGTTLLVLADHGLVDAPARQRINLTRLRGFFDCLATLPSGDARQVMCFVRPAKLGAFRAIVKSRLAEACVCVTGEKLLEVGAFGPGRPHPSLANRVGDFVLLARPGYAFGSSPPGRPFDVYRGNHGGMAPEEMIVPLYVVPC